MAITSMHTGARRFAVVDLETTGFAYNQHDRVIEVGVVLLGDSLSVEHRWETLVNPNRDIGATRVHGIESRDILDAPEFGDIAETLAELIEGRILVAHNALFDTSFLRSEFQRSGAADIDYGGSSVCTMRLAPTVLRAANRSLEACCVEAGISNPHAHSALSDADATAQLFTVLSQDSRVRDETHSRSPLPRVSFRESPRRHGGSPKPRTRKTAPADLGSWMSRIALSMPKLPVGPAEEAYLAILDRAMADKLLTSQEAEELVSVASALNLDRGAVLDLHAQYLHGLSVLAWADGVVTDFERVDLHRVALQLGLSEAVADHLAATPSLRLDKDTLVSLGKDSDAPEDETVEVRLAPGDRVTFTGEMNVDRSEWERRARESGLDVGGVTKKSSLLVAADPYSLSGKAKKARDYGIPIVGEDAFARLLGELR